MAPLQPLAEAGLFEYPTSHRLVKINGLDEYSHPKIQQNILEVLGNSQQQYRLPLIFYLLPVTNTIYLMHFTPECYLTFMHALLWANHTFSTKKSNYLWTTLFNRAYPSRRGVHGKRLCAGVDSVRSLWRLHLIIIDFVCIGLSSLAFPKASNRHLIPHFLFPAHLIKFLSTTWIDTPTSTYCYTFSFSSFFYLAHPPFLWVPIYLRCVWTASMGHSHNSCHLTQPHSITLVSKYCSTLVPRVGSMKTTHIVCISFL